MSSLDIRVKTTLSTTPLYRNKAFLIQKYAVEKLSARQIAVLISCPHSVVNRALVMLGIAKRKVKPGTIEYGFKLTKGRRVIHRREQNIIQQILRMKARGWSHGRIAEKLVRRAIKSPNGIAQWSATTVRSIILRYAKSHD